VQSWNASVPIGVFDRLDRGSAPLAARNEARPTPIAAGDRAGFHAYHVAGDHATPPALSPPPSALASFPATAMPAFAMPAVAARGAAR